MHASLSMYDFPEIRTATDAFWRSVAVRMRGRGVAAPLVLSRDGWVSEGLLLGQTCGYPLVMRLAGAVEIVATPVYLAPGCEGALYRSALVVREDDPADSLAAMRGRRCAVNDAASNSGMNVLRAEVAAVAGGARRFFAEVVMTGAHVASVAAVAAGRADLAAIDCVTWAHLQRLRQESVRHLRVLGWTRSSPGLPLVTASETPADVRHSLVEVLDEVAADPSLAGVRAQLLLGSFTQVSYEAIGQMHQSAVELGYGTLA